MKVNGWMKQVAMVCATWASSVEAQEVSATLLRRMDGASDRIAFKDVSDGVIASRSLQFVADGATPIVVGFAEGRATRVGRIGSGPGEYRQPWRLGIKSDSLIVLESPRLSRYAIQSFAKGTTTVEQMSSTTGNPASVLSESTAGIFFSESQAAGDESVTGRRGYIAVVWRDAKTARAKPVVTVMLPRGSSWRVPAIINGRSYNSDGEQPFMSRPLLAASKNGAGVAVLEQHSDELANRASITLRFWNGLGEAAGQCQWSEAQQPLTKEIFDRLIATAFDDPRVKVRRVDLEKATLRPKLIPAFDLMVYASDGAIWLRTPSRYGTGVDRYLRVDRNCKSRVVVKFDATVTLFDAKDGTALVSFTDDETNEARLYAYRLPPQ